METVIARSVLGFLSQKQSFLSFQLDRCKHTFFCGQILKICRNRFICKLRAKKGRLKLSNGTWVDFRIFLRKITGFNLACDDEPRSDSVVDLPVRFPDRLQKALVRPGKGHIFVTAEVKLEGLIGQSVAVPLGRWLNHEVVKLHRQTIHGELHFRIHARVRLRTLIAEMWLKKEEEESKVSEEAQILVPPRSSVVF